MVEKRKHKRILYDCLVATAKTRTTTTRRGDDEDDRTLMLIWSMMMKSLMIMMVMVRTEGFQAYAVCMPSSFCLTPDPSSCFGMWQVACFGQNANEALHGARVRSQLLCYESKATVAIFLVW